MKKFHQSFLMAPTGLSRLHCRLFVASFVDILHLVFGFQFNQCECGHIIWIQWKSGKIKGHDFVAHRSRHTYSVL